MNLCSSGHEEICFEGRNCPFCIYIQEKESEIAGIVTDAARMQEEIP